MPAEEFINSDNLIKLWRFAFCDSETTFSWFSASLNQQLYNPIQLYSCCLNKVKMFNIRSFLKLLFVIFRFLKFSFKISLLLGNFVKNFFGHEWRLNSQKLNFGRFVVKMSFCKIEKSWIFIENYSDIVTCLQSLAEWTEAFWFYFSSRRNMEQVADDACNRL